LHRRRELATKYNSCQLRPFRIFERHSVLRSWIEKYGVPRALYTDWKNVYIRAASSAEQLRGEVPVTQFGRMCQKLGIRIIAASSPQANPYVERLVGSIRRECLDHVIVWNRRSLHRILESYFAYYQSARPHSSLAKDAPDPRDVEPPEQGRVVAISQVGGLHHRYQRRAA
jgi:transposase InsO family protein